IPESRLRILGRVARGHRFSRLEALCHFELAFTPLRYLDGPLLKTRSVLDIGDGSSGLEKRGFGRNKNGVRHALDRDAQVRAHARPKPGISLVESKLHFKIPREWPAR